MPDDPTQPVQQDQPVQENPDDQNQTPEPKPEEKPEQPKTTESPEPKIIEKEVIKEVKVVDEEEVKKQVMDKTNLEKDKKLLVSTLRKLKSSKGLSSFIDDLLIEEEILDLAQRIKIAKLILDGKTYDEIAAKVGTSTSTVSKIGQIIKYGKGELQKVLEKKN